MDMQSVLQKTFINPAALHDKTPADAGENAYLLFENIACGILDSIESGHAVCHSWREGEQPTLEFATDSGLIELPIGPRSHVQTTVKAAQFAIALMACNWLIWIAESNPTIRSIASKAYGRFVSDLEKNKPGFTDAEIGAIYQFID